MIDSIFSEQIERGKAVFYLTLTIAIYEAGFRPDFQNLKQIPEENLSMYAQMVI